jgi:hypothetical protein
LGHGSRFAGYVETMANLSMAIMVVRPEFFAAASREFQ